MMTMIVEDIAVLAVIALFIWLVPVRGNGIPGLRGRGKVPVSPAPTRPEHVQPRQVPTDEMIGTAPEHGRNRERDTRILADLDSTWDAGYADRVAAQLRAHKDSA